MPGSRPLALRRVLVYEVESSETSSGPLMIRTVGVVRRAGRDASGALPAVEEHSDVDDDEDDVGRDLDLACQNLIKIGRTLGGGFPLEMVLADDSLSRRRASASTPSHSDSHDDAADDGEEEDGDGDGEDGPASPVDPGLIHAAVEALPSTRGETGPVQLGWHLLCGSAAVASSGRACTLVVFALLRPHHNPDSATGMLPQSAEIASTDDQRVQVDELDWITPPLLPPVWRQSVQDLAAHLASSRSRPASVTPAADETSASPSSGAASPVSLLSASRILTALSEILTRSPQPDR